MLETDNFEEVSKIMTSLQDGIMKEARILYDEVIEIETNNYSGQDNIDVSKYSETAQSLHANL